MSGAQVGLLAVGAWLLARWPPPGPWPGLLVAVAAGLVLVATRRPGALVVAVLALVAVRAGPDAAAPTGGRVTGSVVLVADPEGDLAGVQALGELDGVRFQLRAAGGAAAALRSALTGDVVHLRGTRSALPSGASWLRDRHVTGVLVVDAVTGWEPARGPAGLANRARLLLWRGAASLPDDQRALFAGFVVGDDRSQSPLVADAFAGSGLTHLTAVSGQNVAFVLAVLAPLLGRIPWRARLIVVVVALAGFTLVTRAEPSVLRAVVMAGLATMAASRGRELPGLRSLGLALAGLLVVDPRLGGRPGFVLSVVAAAGILVLGGPLAEHLRGPRPVRLALAVTLSAQVATAPVLAALFGGVPLAAVPANVLAEPAAGALMVWGLTGGALAGAAAALGWGDVAAMLHLPSRLLLWWVEGVASSAASLPLGRLDTVGALAVAVAAAAWWLVVARPGARGPAGRRRPHRLVVAGAVVAVGAALLAALVAPFRSGPPLAGAPLGRGARVWRAASAPSHRAGVVVLDGRADTGTVLREARALGVQAVELVVVRTTSPAAASVVADLRRRLDVSAVVAPIGAPIPDVAAPAEVPRRFSGGAVAVGVAAQGAAGASTLDVTVELVEPP